MFSKNVGSTDRILRVIAGVALLVAFFMFPDAGYRWVFLFGIVPLATGLLGTCGLYKVLGISTCPMKNG